MDFVRFGEIRVSRLILGSNPFSGFSHHGPEMDLQMMRYYKTGKIKETLFEAQRLGINTVVSRTDHHVMRFLLEYWDEGGTLQWFAQTCPEVGPQEMCVERAVSGQARACHIHGGVADHLYAQGRLDELVPVVRQIHETGMLAGIAGHQPGVIKWAEENLEVDYYMCSYYNPIGRDDNPEHVRGMAETYLEKDRKVMTDLIKGLSRPVIHYKVMAAGRNDPAEAFAYAAGCMRPEDAVCVGVYTEKNPEMLEEDVNLLGKYLARAEK
ncbi:MAG TPA: hypothetical protein VM123_04970 [archaeon]|nr:hypothetical protein [archaeon]